MAGMKYSERDKGMKIQLLLDGQIAAEIDIDEGERIIGSNAHGGILIEDASVAPEHAKIYQEGGDLLIADLGSGTGTFVDGRKIAGPIALHNGQSIRIGEFELQLNVLAEECNAADEIPPCPQPAPTKETPGDDGASAMSAAKSAAAGIGKGLLGMAGASAKEAGRGARLASLKTQIEKLRRTDLRRAYVALGAKARTSGLAQQACPELIAEILALDSEIAEKRKGSDAGENAGIMAKAKAKALGAKMWAEAEMLERKINGILATIGEKLADNPPEDSSVRDELREIADIGMKIQALQNQFDSAYADGSAREAFAASAGSVQREATLAASADNGSEGGRRPKLVLAGLAMGLLSIPLLLVKPMALLLAFGALIAGCIGWFSARKSGGPRCGGKLNIATIAIALIVISSCYLAGKDGTQYSPLAEGVWCDNEGTTLFYFKKGDPMAIITPYGTRLRKCKEVKSNVYEFMRWDENGIVTFRVLDERTARLEAPDGTMLVMNKLIRGTPEQMIAMMTSAWAADRQNANALTAGYIYPTRNDDAAPTSSRFRDNSGDFMESVRENQAKSDKYARERQIQQDQRNADRERRLERTQQIASLNAEIQALRLELQALSAQADSERQAHPVGANYPGSAASQLGAKRQLLNLKQDQLRRLQAM